MRSARDSACRVLSPILLASAIAGGVAGAAEAQWAQWGGPNRDFKLASADLSTEWPQDGPPRLWTRDLGEGYSAISVDDGILYTMYRRDDNTEVVVAMDAASGATRWEHAYDASVSGLNVGKGAGPHSTPLITAGRVYTVGVRTFLLCLEAQTGEVIWSRDLWKEFDAEPSGRGYSSSPLAYMGMVILPVGGKDGHGVMAFDLESGEVAWNSQDFGPTFSSPLIVDVDGQDQLVVFEGTHIIGLEPGSGELLWTFPHPTQYNVNAATPVWGPDGHLYVSSAYDAGSRVVRLARANGKTQVEEVWYDHGMKVHHGTAIRLGEMVYGSSGDFGPAFLMGAHVKTGEMTAKQRGFAKANLVGAGEHLILLDEDGMLAILRPGPEKLEVLAQAQIFSGLCWTVPTLVGTTLYARDRKQIVALDLAAR